MSKNRILWGVVILLLTGVISIYGYITYYYSKRYYPDTWINGIDCSEKTCAESLKEQTKLIDIYKFEIASDIMEKKEMENSKYIEFDDEGSYKKILKNQTPYEWPLYIRKKHEYKAGKLKFNEENIKGLAGRIIEENKGDVIEPVDARLQYNETTKIYDVIEDKHGNQFLENRLQEILLTKIREVTIEDTNEKQYKEIDITDSYERAAILRDTKKVLKARGKLNKYLAASITWTFGDDKIILDADTIHKFLFWDKNYKPSIEKDMVADYLYENLTKKINTYGNTRHLMLKSGKADVKGGTYGWIVDLDKEIKKTLSAIKEGKKEERRPFFTQEAKADGEDDIGNTYIDISIDDQHVWLVHKDKTIMDSDCVTGNTSAGRGTPKGTYFIEYKTTNYTMKKYNAHVDYWMPFDTTYGVGLHDADWRSEFGGSIYRYDGSHGCVNLPPGFARRLYNNKYVTPGLPVIVH